MSRWEMEFADAVSALEAAYAADQRAYDEMSDPHKASWALLPVRMWPEPDRRIGMLRARTALMSAEEAVRDFVRRQSIAVRAARAHRLEMYKVRAFASTARSDLGNSHVLLSPVASGRPATSPPTET